MMKASLDIRANNTKWYTFIVSISVSVSPTLFEICVIDGTAKVCRLGQHYSLLAVHVLGKYIFNLPFRMIFPEFIIDLLPFATYVS